MLGSSLPARLCIQEAFLVPPVDGAGSWLSVVAAHLCRVPGLPHLHQVADQPHQSLVGNQDSESKLQSMKDRLTEHSLFFLRVLSLPGSFFVYLWVFQFPFGSVCFSAHLVDVRAVFFLPASCAAIGS